jgi:hypothetical protein
MRFSITDAKDRSLVCDERKATVEIEESVAQKKMGAYGESDYTSYRTTVHSIQWSEWKC